MARSPRASLLETTELPIVETDIEEGVIPFFICDDRYGVAVNEDCYMLVEKKQAARTVKDEDGNPDHVEKYIKWDSFKYTSTFQAILKTYVSLSEKNLNKKLIKEKGFQKILENYEQTRKHIENMLSVEGVNKGYYKACDVIERLNNLDADIKAVETRKNLLLQECDNLEKLIKEKRKIVVEKHTQNK